MKLKWGELFSQHKAVERPPPAMNIKTTLIYAAATSLHATVYLAMLEACDSARVPPTPRAHNIARQHSDIYVKGGHGHILYLLLHSATSDLCAHQVSYNTRNISWKSAQSGLKFVTR
eukprot:1889848-Pleurochrysis_carterae.AAC.1